MPRNILLSQYFLPLSAVSLGRFVISLNNPHQEFHEPMHDVSLNLTENIQTQYDSLHRSAKQQSLASQFTTFLSSSFTRRLKTSVRITADQAKTYYLNNVGQCFRDAVKSQATREWIERTIDEGEDIYVVVAYHTLVNARILEQSGGQSSTGGNLAIPVSTALTASGVVVPFDMADPGLSGFSGNVEDEQRQFVAPGEQVYAVQYRKVTWRWFSRDKVDELKLGNKSWWENMTGRGVARPSLRACLRWNWRNRCHYLMRAMTSARWNLEKSLSRFCESCWFTYTVSKFRRMSRTITPQNLR